MRVLSIWIVFVACYAPMTFAQAAIGDFIGEVIAKRAGLVITDWDAKQMIGLPTLHSLATKSPPGHPRPRTGRERGP